MQQSANYGSWASSSSNQGDPTTVQRQQQPYVYAVWDQQWSWRSQGAPTAIIQRCCQQTAMKAEGSPCAVAGVMQLASCRCHEVLVCSHSKAMLIATLYI